MHRSTKQRRAARRRQEFYKNFRNAQLNESIGDLVDANADIIASVFRLSCIEAKTVTTVDMS